MPMLNGAGRFRKAIPAEIQALASELALARTRQGIPDACQPHSQSDWLIGLKVRSHLAVNRIASRHHLQLELLPCSQGAPIGYRDHDDRNQKCRTSNTFGDSTINGSESGFG